MMAGSPQQLVIGHGKLSASLPLFLGYHGLVALLLRAARLPLFRSAAWLGSSSV